ncbi:hypothetical protein B0A49_13389 [Cryomyces minteri]|uniref:3-hydroxyisobutyrate dehydrogenase, mitochondrial n=1 Tax=Cryomyces minteri TaxID=331657 RepID=A0A4U0X419_9PEZI|nr:hypothetical protein B0A49_13389 [Cryomyces minteri]
MGSSKPTIAFCGLGAMGGGMATNLVKNGFPVIGFDVYTPLVDSLVARGGRAAQTPAEAAREASFLVCMVANAAQVVSLLFEADKGAIHGLQRDAMMMLCSTCPPYFLHDLRERLDKEGRSDVKLLDCPVSGGTIRAADGTLSIFSSGPATDLDNAKEILECMSGNLYRIEGGISNGTKVKTIHQLMATTNIVMASEAMGLAAVAGLNTETVFEHVKSSDGTSFMFENRVPHMLKNDWHPYSALAIILKDAGIVTDTGRKNSFPMPLANTAEQLYISGVARGWLRDDDACMVQLFLPSSSPDLVSSKAKADVKMASNFQVSSDTVNDLLAGVHLAASIEAMAFAKHLGMDTRLMYEIISKAAGWCKIFDDAVPPMLEADQWALGKCSIAEK